MKRIPVAALVAANLVVAGIAVFDDWGYYGVLLTFWMEGVIIGFYNVGRIFTVCLAGEPFGKRVGVTDAGARLMYGLIFNGVFIMKFGGLALGTGILCLALPAAFVKEEGSADLIAVTIGIQTVGEGVLLASAVLFVSHGVSFFMNYIGRREYTRDNVVKLLFWPYVRMSLMVIVILSALALSLSVQSVGESTLFAIFLIGLKLCGDLVSHLWEHSRLLRKGVPHPSPEQTAPL